MLENPRGLNPLTERVIGAAIDVHRALGPGLLETAYKRAMLAELRERELAFRSECAIPLVYRGLDLEVEYRADLIVADVVLVELKAVQELAPVHIAQVSTYLKLTGCPVGLLINFNVQLLRKGVRRVLHPDVRRPGLP